MQEPGGEFTVKRSLYHRPSAPVYPSGLFLDPRFNRLGGLATMEKAWLCERRQLTVEPHQCAQRGLSELLEPVADRAIAGNAGATTEPREPRIAGHLA